MATYAVGDIQGCLAPLKRLLDKVEFEPGRDCLWVAGDLINRGPDSLTTLRFIRQLGASTRIVLGNHDLHLLGVAFGERKLGRKDTIDPILKAPDRDELLHWLRHQPLLHHDADLGYVMTHAGIPPIWTLDEAKARAKEVEQALQGEHHAEFFSHMYGSTPEIWRNDLAGWNRLRIIVNYLTRMRFCSPDGRLDLKAKQGIDSAPPGLAPWFSHPNHRCRDQKILFGHWAALEGKTGTPNAIALDTGCVWGNALTMMRLEDGEMFSTSCRS
jgi:bis(5'-nucleosyl)-tetraphosphatase (symmetrical)